jgi:predicted RNA-binding Zn-ribbon protein involved in translation (DUF1610 family)
MTTIKATCPTCGEVGLTPDEVELRVDRSGREESFYAFTCPACLSVVRKPADQRIVRLLVSGGVELREIKPRVRLRDRSTGPAFTHDDLLDLHTLLQSDDWFDTLVALG